MKTGICLFGVVALLCGCVSTDRAAMERQKQKEDARWAERERRIEIGRKAYAEELKNGRDPAK